MKKKIVFINGSAKRGGATDEIVDLIIKHLDKSVFECRTINLSEYDINYCKGCRVCHETAECVLSDDMTEILSCMDASDIAVMISPSYWADITGQMKVFIDRCTPYCDTHEPHAALSVGKAGYAVALRTGQNPSECLHIIDSFNHFYGHMGIADAGSFYLCGIDTAEDVQQFEDKIADFAQTVL
jgi:Multimeric flavodoxin WrbA